MNQLVVLTTTVERYSLVVEASQREEAALEAWRKAGQAYSDDKSTANAVRLAQASIALTKAQDDFRDVVRKTFPPIERKIL